MLIAAGLAAASLVTSPLSATTLPPPAMIVNVAAAADVQPSLVARLLDEASSLWRPAGLTFVWQRKPNALPGTLTVSIGAERGSRAADDLPLGWIRFDDVDTPVPEIYLSTANARELLERWTGSSGAVDRMPRQQQEVLLGRAMGRALAHELGHYLLASKSHTARGLMRARREAPEFFAESRKVFALDPEQHAQVVARMAGRIVGR
jgi:hypothetical protein